MFPLVASRIVLPGYRRPLRSPSRIIRSAARSFTEPPGFKCSAFTNNSTPTGKSRAMFRKRSKGVWPICDSKSAKRLRSSRCGTMISAVSIIEVKTKPAATFAESRPAFQTFRGVRYNRLNSRARKSRPVAPPAGEAHIQAHQ